MADRFITNQPDLGSQPSYKEGDVVPSLHPGPMGPQAQAPRPGGGMGDVQEAAKTEQSRPPAAPLHATLKAAWTLFQRDPQAFAKAVGAQSPQLATQALSIDASQPDAEQTLYRHLLDNFPRVRDLHQVLTTLPTNVIENKPGAPAAPAERFPRAKNKAKREEKPNISRDRGRT